MVDFSYMASHNVVIIDPSDTTIASQVSELLIGATDKFRASIGGHVPDEVVLGSIHKNYVSLFAIQQTFKDTGYRFALVDRKGLVLATALVAKEPDQILVVDGKNINVLRQEFQNVCPAGYHNVLNFVVKNEYQKNGLGKELLKSLLTDYRELFSGKGLWLRSDPPNHNAYQKMGFIHETRYDKFLPEDAILPINCKSVEDFNKKYLCTCERPYDQLVLSKTCRYKYSVFIYDFE